MPKKKLIPSQIDLAIKALEEKGHTVSSLKSKYIDVSMSQSVNIKNAKVKLITFFGGSQALLIGDKMYDFEISLYELRDDDEVVDKKFRELGMEIYDYGDSIIEKA